MAAQGGGRPGPAPPGVPTGPESHSPGQGELLGREESPDHCLCQGRTRCFQGCPRPLPLKSTGVQPDLSPLPRHRSSDERLHRAGPRQHVQPRREAQRAPAQVQQTPARHREQRRAGHRGGDAAPGAAPAGTGGEWAAGEGGQTSRRGCAGANLLLQLVKPVPSPSCFLPILAAAVICPPSPVLQHGLALLSHHSLGPDVAVPRQGGSHTIGVLPIPASLPVAPELLLSASVCLWASDSDSPARADG